MIDEGYIYMLEIGNVKVIDEKRNSIPIDVIICYTFVAFSRFMTIHNPRKSIHYDPYFGKR